MADRPVVVLNMIVKDEASVIERCLNSVRPFIDCWCIVDTGSTDGTQEIIRRIMGDLPGVLYERPWVDFATNRTEALQLAKNWGDYTLIIDADDVLAADAGFAMPEPIADSYQLRIDFGPINYYRPHLIRSTLPWAWKGVIHEFLTCSETHSTADLTGLAIKIHHDGARRRDPLTYRKDAAALEEALKTEQDPFLIARYRFYLAQSYRDCGDRERAIVNYLLRAEMGFWDEEVYLSLVYAARMMVTLCQMDRALLCLRRAIDLCPHRSEAAFEASLLCLHLQRYKEAFEYAQGALLRPVPAGLFVERWIYEHGIEDQYAVCAYWVGEYRAALESGLNLLSRNDLAPLQRERIVGNMRMTLAKVLL